MNEESDLLVVVARVLNTLDIRYFVTGSVAAMHYGESRFTRDIDIVVHMQMGKISDLLEAFASPEFYVSREAILSALEAESQFNVVHVPSGMKVDFMCPGRSAFNQSRFERAQQVEFVPGTQVWFSAPEDVILKKLEYFREGGSEKHLRDIASMVRVSGDTFDREYLQEWAKYLGVDEEWAACKERIGW